MTREEAIKNIKLFFTGINIALSNKTKEALDVLIPELHESVSEDERTRRELVKFISDIKSISESGRTTWAVRSDDAKMCETFLAYLEKQKDASKAMEAVDRIDKYIDKQVANAHDMKDSNPDKKYYLGWDDALGEMAGILQDVYSDEKQKEQKPITESKRLANEVIEYLTRCGYSPVLKDDSKKEHFHIDIPRHKDDFWQSEEYKHCRSVLGEYYMEGDYGGDTYTLYIWRAKKEQKPAEWSYPYGENETVDRLVSIAECLEMDGDCLFNGYTGTECGKFLRDLARKQVECKPVGWSEEDEGMLLSIINDFRNGTVSTIGKEQWLKWLPERFNLQPKQEWSEEDEIRLKEALEVLDESIKHLPMGYGFTKDVMYVKDWLKSLRPSWKPSKEQLEALRIAMDRNDSIGYNLRQLYEQLKN